MTMTEEVKNIETINLVIDDSVIYCYECCTDLKKICKRHRIKWVVNKRIDCLFSNIEYPLLLQKYFKKSNNLTCSCNQDDYKHIENTLPNFLILKKSSLYKENIGVWTLEFIKKGTIFGPFLGKFISIGKVNDDVFESSVSGRAWLIHRNEEDKDDHIVDASNSFNSNWMRYVSCCFEYSKQNLIAIQYDGLIFYRACEDILTNTELVVNHEIQHERDVELEKEKTLSTSIIKTIDATTSDSDVDVINTSGIMSADKEIIDLSCHPEDLSSTSHRLNLIDDNQTSSDNPCSPTIKTPSISVHCQISNSTDIDLSKSVTHIPLIPLRVVHKPLCIYSNLPVKESYSKSVHNISSKTVPTFRSVSIGYFDRPERQQAVFKSLINVSKPPTSNFRCPKRLRNSFLPTSPNDGNSAFPKPVLTLKCSQPKQINVGNECHQTPNILETIQLNLLSQKEPNLNYALKIGHQNLPSRRLMYKSIESTSSDSYFNSLTFDEQSAHYLSKILNFEPYLSVENIIACLAERFPLKPACHRLAILNILKSTNIREQNSIWIQVDEDIISTVVSLFKKHPNWTFQMIQCELGKLFPQCPVTGIVAIENIVRSNFSEKNVNKIEKRIVQFIHRLVKKKPMITIQEINLSLRDHFPDNKIISNIVIDDILNRFMRIENVTDTIDSQVNKLVDEIYKKWNQGSRFKS